jgi:cyclic pyranopterin phosphate synthase
MVDVSPKEETERTATAVSSVHLAPAVAAAFSEAAAVSPTTAKGPVFDVSRLAGIMGAKQTSSLIPLCHPLALSHVDVELEFARGRGGDWGDVDYSRVDVRCTARCRGRTGVEMEAMVGASVAGLAVYDMVKGLSHECVVGEVRLQEKGGGKRRVRDGRIVD